MRVLGMHFWVPSRQFKGLIWSNLDLGFFRGHWGAGSRTMWGGDLKLVFVLLPGRIVGGWNRFLYLLTVSLSGPMIEIRCFLLHPLWPCMHSICLLCLTPAVLPPILPPPSKLQIRWPAEPKFRLWGSSALLSLCPFNPVPTSFAWSYKQTGGIWWYQYQYEEEKP